LLEDLCAKISAAQRTPNPDISKKAVLVFCADNAIAQKGASAWPSSLTATLAGLVRDGLASVCAMSKCIGCEAFPVDVGMATDVSGVRSFKTVYGASDFSSGPAMTSDACEKAMEAGIRMALELKAKGFGIIAAGEAGIGNTAAAAAVGAALLKLPASLMAGRGAGLDDAGLARKTALIEQGLSLNKPDPQDPMDVLRKVGSLDMAAMAGAFLGGASVGIPVIMDGYISSAAALCAAMLCKDALGYIIPSHESAEPGMKLILKELGLTSVIQAQMRLGEGTGAVALMPLLDMALAVKEKAARIADII
jgi:nicotinate-nucleotide--dimethylbenzimidazole phosphoribosyltransferase